MTENTATGNATPPKWFTIVCVFAIVWNLLGVMAFMTGPVMNVEALNTLSPAEQNLYSNMPFWAKLAFAIAVFAGAIGSFVLLLKQAIAKYILWVSLTAALVQMFHVYFISNSWQVFGPGGTIMPIMVISVAIYLVVLANKVITLRWTK